MGHNHLRLRGGHKERRGVVSTWSVVRGKGGMRGEGRKLGGGEGGREIEGRVAVDG